MISELDCAALTEDLLEHGLTLGDVGGINGQEPAQSGHQIASRGFEDQMKMVFHQTKGMNLEAGFLAGLAQGFDEIMAIALIKEDGFTTISPAQNMIDRAGVLNAYGTCYPSILPQKTPGGKCTNGQIYGLTPAGLTPAPLDINTHEHYNEQAWYSLFPQADDDDYNSNGYASGLLDIALGITDGGTVVQPPNTPGFEKPVPPSYFP